MAAETRDADPFNRTADALLSAIARLPTPVFALTGGRSLRPLNRAATELAEFEQLPLSVSAPSHPLKDVIDTALDPRAEAPHRAIVSFTSGRRYSVDVSDRSEKGAERWLLVLVHPAGAGKEEIELAARKFQFTPREQELAAWIVAGRTSEEICEEMGIARSTLKTHLSTILSKTGCRNRTQLVAVLLNPNVEK